MFAPAVMLGARVLCRLGSRAGTSVCPTEPVVWEEQDSCFRRSSVLLLMGEVAEAERTECPLEAGVVR